MKEAVEKGAEEQLWLGKLAGSAAYKLTHTHTDAQTDVYKSCV